MFTYTIGFLKIKGTNSDYAKLENIKEILENELNTYRTITINDLIYINQFLQI